ncbi:hypothetical protein MKW92_014538 [Papaver armeniacum]|nr:hypothetical protein MKW92_014538 [Papaver armeniacum]
MRITVNEILEDLWFKKGLKPPVFEGKSLINLDDVDADFEGWERVKIELGPLSSLLWTMKYRTYKHHCP